jgi:hypothetical protein
MPMRHTLGSQYHFRLSAKSIPRFVDFTEQPGSLHFTHRCQLGQDRLTPPVERSRRG